MALKKITRKHFDSLKSDEQKIVLSLGLEIEEEFRPSRQAKDSILTTYAMVVETTCKLCKSSSIRVFSMEGTGGLLISHESSLEQVDGMTIKTSYETTITCPACHDILKLMSQEDLIALTIKAAKGLCRCVERR